MSKYIPPHLRGPQRSTDASNEPSTRIRDPFEGYTLEEIAQQFGYGDTKLGTLNTLRPRPTGEPEEGGNEGEKEYKEELGFIVVFKNQHPEWPPKIFCKSNLHLLPNHPWTKDGTDQTIHGEPISAIQEPDGSSGAKKSRAIHVFQQMSSSTTLIKSRVQQRFLYSGAHSIKSTVFIKPRSKELIELLDLKFKTLHQDRREEMWEKSLKMNWAIVELEKVDWQVESPMKGLLLVQRKGVSEMLQELRMGKDVKEKAGGGSENIDRVRS